MWIGKNCPRTNSLTCLIKQPTPLWNEITNVYPWHPFFFHYFCLIATNYLSSLYRKINISTNIECDCVLRNWTIKKVYVTLPDLKSLINIDTMIEGISFKNSNIIASVYIFIGNLKMKKYTQYTKMYKIFKVRYSLWYNNFFMILLSISLVTFVYYINICPLIVR